VGDIRRRDDTQDRQAGDNPGVRVRMRATRPKHQQEHGQEDAAEHGPRSAKQQAQLVGELSGEQVWDVPHDRVSAR
jgi:hypothetical protein